ncbi:unnamed protein product [Oppiella nova]|uniref:Uncharacterized protein n=1 Tax=Oppiella nova TaxID=334625 RepID=A0A7R9LW51_9ACAR|nr:unnamed protein product [Oppiella nova]CAG2167537.1 unnamed protein product [Oppiella nova]
MIQSIDTDYWEVRSQASTDSQDIKGTVAITGSTSSAAIEQVFPNAEPNANNYCNYSGYQNLNTPRIQSAPNGSSAQRLLPKGGKHRNANILSAVLCLIKELDYASLEVVDTTIHCRMEEMED